MARKSMRFLRGRSVDGHIELFIERGMPLINEPSDTLSVRIFRKKEEAFEQGSDYMEYFDGLSHTDATLIYEGPLQKRQRYHFVYVDKDVQPLDVYAYWIAYEKDEVPLGPLGLAVRDPQVWWTFDKINRTMQHLYDTYNGQKALTLYGVSTRKKQLYGLRLGCQSPCIGLMGAIHAGESGTELYLRAAETIMKQRPELLEKVGLAILPSVNADGREDMATGVPNYVRCNPNGVDLNRNFDAQWENTDYTYGLNTSVFGSITYRGPCANSEDETRAVISFLKHVRPKVLFCGHCLSSICSDSFLTAKDAKGDEAYRERAHAFCKEYTKGFRDVEKEGVSFHYGCTAGSIPAYAYKTYGIPAFDLEFRPVKDEARERQCIVGKTDRSLLDEFTHYHTEGILHVMQEICQNDI